MEIRFLSPEDDLSEVSSIYEKSWKYAYQGIIPQDYLDSIPEGRWANGITKNGMHSLVMTDGGRMIGTTGFCRSRWEQYRDFGEIVSIYLLPEYIGKGYGTHLLNRCTEELRRLGFSRILLWVLEENTRARAFYERNGFLCSDACRDDMIGGKELREVMYTKNIRG